MEKRNKNVEFKIQEPKVLARFPNSKFQIQNSGVSLLELLIYIAILSVLVVVVSDAFISLSKGRGQAEARSEVNSAIRFATELMKKDIKNGSEVLVPTLGAPASTLSINVSPDIILYDTFGGKLRRSVNAGPPEEVTGNAVFVDVPIFTRLENFNPYVGVGGATTTGVQVMMTMRYNASSTDWKYSDTLRTTITLR